MRAWCLWPTLVCSQQLFKGKLSKSLFPYFGTEMPPSKLSTVMVFIIGGCTFEEAARVATLNASDSAPAAVVLGGTMLLNSKR